MKFTGNWPTSAELDDMCAPYSKNDGEDWTLEKIRDCVVAGGDGILNNSEVMSTFKDGLTMLKVEQKASPQKV